MVCNHKVGKEGDNFIVRLSGSGGYLVTECDEVTPTPSPSPSPSATPPAPSASSVPVTPTPTPSKSGPSTTVISVTGWYCFSGVECPEPTCSYHESGDTLVHYCNISGPFATEAECSANCSNEPASPTSTPTGTPGSTPTPTP